MARKIKEPLLDIAHGDIDGEPFETLVRYITSTWESLSAEERKTAEFKIGSVSVWYYRAETEEDKRDWAEYERLKSKFEGTEFIEV